MENDRRRLKWRSKWEDEERLTSKLVGVKDRLRQVSQRVSEERRI